MLCATLQLPADAPIDHWTLPKFSTTAPISSSDLGLMDVQVFSGPQLRPADRLRIFIYELPHELVQVCIDVASHHAQLYCLLLATLP